MNTHGESLEVHCERTPWDHGVKFWVKRKSWSPERLEIAFAQPLEFWAIKPEDEGRQIQESFRLKDEQAQNFMDELWRVGFRPMEGSGSAGSLAATERHLADMRTLVFKIEQSKQ